MSLVDVIEAQSPSQHDRIKTASHYREKQANIYFALAAIVRDVARY
jgi:hypothetical protein